MSAIIARLDALLQSRRAEIEEWLHAKRTHKRPYIYSSVDLRHSGAKLAPVDTNLFPAGFNNLSQAARHRSARFFAEKLAELSVHNVLILPENHTRNLGYLENLAVLSDILKAAGAETRIASFNALEKLTLETMSGRTIEEWPLKREGDKVRVDGFDPDFLLLNNDCTAGIPESLIDVSQPLEPHYKLGWYNRRKSEHFRAYDDLVRDFADAFGFDPWLISTTYHRCGVVNFHEAKGSECVAVGVEKVLHAVRRKYAEHGIADAPYVFVKADSGTYGMGIMTVRSGEEAIALNKKARNKMNVIKEGTANTEVIIQEGIPTTDHVGEQPAEPMMYLVDGIPVGGAYRVNESRDTTSNLNAAGMRFVGMCDEGECGGDPERIKVDDCNFGVFGLIAALAALAAPREVYDTWKIGFSI